MAGTRRPDGAETRDALLLGVALGFLLGVMAGVFFGAYLG